MWDFCEESVWFFGARRMFGQLINGPLVKSFELFTHTSCREREGESDERDLILDDFCLGTQGSQINWVTLLMLSKRRFLGAKSL